MVSVTELPAATLSEVLLGAMVTDGGGPTVKIRVAATNNRIRKVAVGTGVISTFAGNGAAGGRAVVSAVSCCPIAREGADRRDPGDRLRGCRPVAKKKRKDPTHRGGYPSMVTRNIQEPITGI
jgi:hypothetical protein